MVALLEIYERSDRACLGVDPETFFPVYSGHSAEEKAKRICAGCPVREGCLDFAIDTGQQYGIWGGLNQDERAAEVRQRNKAARQAQAGGAS